MGESKSKGTFLKEDSKVVGYMVYPRFLMGLELNETAKLIYVLLLDRARLSIKQGGWADEEGNVYIYYDIKSLSADSGKSAGTVKAALKELEKADLIFRANQEVGKPRRIYVKTRSENCPSPWIDSWPLGGQKTVSHGDSFSTLYNTIAKTNRTKTNISRNYSYGKGESL